jgi:hypothetical protein
MNKIKFRYLIKHPSLDIRKGVVYADNHEDAIEICKGYIDHNGADRKRADITIEEHEQR